MGVGVVDDAMYATRPVVVAAAVGSFQHRHAVHAGDDGVGQIDGQHIALLEANYLGDAAGHVDELGHQLHLRTEDLPRHALAARLVAGVAAIGNRVLELLAQRLDPRVGHASLEVA